MAKEDSTSDQMKAGTTATIEQVRRAMTDYFQFLKDRMGNTPWAGTEQSKKMMEYGEKNLLATLDFAEELAGAKSFDDLARIQTAFARRQMEAFGEQARVLTEAGVKATTELFKFPLK